MSLVYVYVPDMYTPLYPPLGYPSPLPAPCATLHCHSTVWGCVHWPIWLKQGDTAVWDHGRWHRARIPLFLVQEAVFHCFWSRRQYSTVSGPGRLNLSKSSPGRLNLSKSSPGRQNLSISSPGRQNTSISSPVRQNTSISSPGGRNTSIYSPGGRNTSISSPGGRNTSISSPGGRNTAKMTGKVPRHSNTAKRTG